MGVVLKLVALRMAASVDMTTSRSSPISNAKTSVGIFLCLNFKLSFFILKSFTKQRVISPDNFAPSFDRVLRIAFFILFGLMGIFFWKFLMVILNSLLFRIGYAAVVYAA